MVTRNISFLTFSFSFPPQSFDGTCDLPIEKPGAAGLQSVCENGLKDALAGFDTDVESVTEGECRGQWVHKHPSVETARAALSADLEERKQATLSENDARIGRECRKTSEGYVHEAATAFTKIADGDVPDEAALDRSAAELLGGAGRAILAVWQPWDGEVVTQCVAQTAAAIQDELLSAKVRVELRLFGSDEMRVWREEWVASLDGQLAGCFVCRVHSHFLQGRIRELALATMPKEIAGSPVSEGFRNGIATKAVNVVWSTVNLSFWALKHSSPPAIHHTGKRTQTADSRSRNLPVPYRGASHLCRCRNCVPRLAWLCARHSPLSFLIPPSPPPSRGGIKRWQESGGLGGLFDSQIRGGGFSTRFRLPNSHPSSATHKGFQIRLR